MVDPLGNMYMHVSKTCALMKAYALERMLHLALCWISHSLLNGLTSIKDALIKDPFGCWLSV